jgi:hypothetical protein
MGLLDDAIREHLDLKRRRGADPAEVERAEREALGPVRRGPEEPEPGDTAPDDSLAYDQEREEDWDEPFEEPGEEFAYDETDEPEPFAEEEGHLPEERAMREPPAPREQPPAAADAFEDVPGATKSRPRREADAGPPTVQHPGDETAEYQVEEEFERGNPDKNPGDVLEETPDFLQDTPDHDRLWFEQRPPRDFDFEG